MAKTAILTRPFLGIPVWIWGTVIGGGLLVGVYLRQRGSAAQQAGGIQVIQPQGAPPQASTGTDATQAVVELGEMFAAGITDLGALLTGTVQSYAETSQAQFNALGEAISVQQQATLEAIQAIPLAIPQPQDVTGLLGEILSGIGGLGQPAPPQAPPPQVLPPQAPPISPVPIIVGAPPGPQAGQPVGQSDTSGKRVLYWSGQPFYKQSTFRAWINQRGSTIKKLQENNPQAYAVYQSLPA